MQRKNNLHKKILKKEVEAKSPPHQDPSGGSAASWGCAARNVYDGKQTRSGSDCSSFS